MPTPAAFGVEFAIAVVEVAELDDEEDEEVAVVPELFEELMTPEVLTELQGTDGLLLRRQRRASRPPRNSWPGSFRRRRTSAVRA